MRILRRNRLGGLIHEYSQFVQGETVSGTHRVDGYANLDPGGWPGLGAHAHAESGIPVIRVAKSRFRTTTHAVPVVRGSSGRSLFVTAASRP